MTKDVLKTIDEIRNTVETLQNELKQKTEEVKSLSKKNIELEDEMINLSKVSLVAGLTRQVDDKNQRIKLLEKQLENFKKSSSKISKLTVEDSESEDESEEIQVEEGFELITHDEKKLLKNLETRKLYYISTNGSKGKYAGKESKKGKIKLKD